jgi:hypothetical protein
LPHLPIKYLLLSSCYTYFPDKYLIPFFSIFLSQCIQVINKYKYEDNVEVALEGLDEAALFASTNTLIPSETGNYVRANGTLQPSYMNDGYGMDRVFAGNDDSSLDRINSYDYQRLFLNDEYNYWGMRLDPNSIEFNNFGKYLLHYSIAGNDPSVPRYDIDYESEEWVYVSSYDS